MLDPFNKGDGAGAMADIWLGEVLERFPNDRYALYYLKHEYDSESGIWTLPDFSEKTRGAPAWAAGVCEGFNLLIELSEWWIDNKQMPNGSIGGGWGDDVEFVGLFGYTACISEGSTKHC